MNMIKIVAVPMHKEGRKFVFAFAILTALLTLLWAPLFWIGLGLTTWCYYFFRDPLRVVPQNEDLVLSPADGIVSLISEVVPPEEMQLGSEKRIRVSIFMSVFNCHINRAPVAGTIDVVSYHHGKFLNASLDKASEDNERNSIVIKTDSGVKIGVTQIAGLIARRILCFVKTGDTIKKGHRFGLIRFGSRLDVYLPPGCQPAVGIGQTAIAGETILAALSGEAVVVPSQIDLV